MTQIQASFCANMLQKNDDIILFFKAFAAKLGGSGSFTGAQRTNNWLRPAYQLLMYHTAFLGEIDSILVENLLIGLVATYYTESESINIRSNICRTLLFLLKRRRYDHNFCKEDIDGNRNSGYLHAVINLLTVRGDAPLYKWQGSRRLNNNIKNATNLFIWKYIHITNCTNSKIRYLYKTVMDNLFPEKNYQVFVNLLTSKMPENIKDMEDYIISTKNSYLDLTVFRNKISSSCLVDDDWGEIVNKYLNGRGNLDIPVGD